MQPRSRLPQSGFTLVEMLVAMAITLILMGAVVNIFGWVGDSVSESRATIEMSERLRAARTRLQLDLAGATATTLPPLRPESDEGYTRISEGPSYQRANQLPFSDRLIIDRSNPNGPGIDLSNSSTQSMADTRFGDIDDILIFTTRSRGEPFVGKFNSSTGSSITTIESQVAEVVWVVQPTPGTLPPDQTFTLYRTVFLVLPNAPVPDVDLNLSLQDFRNRYDLSAHYDPTTSKIVLNTLGDLTKPGHDPQPGQANSSLAMAFRFGHSADYPHALVQWAPYSGARFGEDVMLSNVLAFDVKVFDYGAPMAMMNGTTPMVPSDPGFEQGTKIYTSWPSGAAKNFGAFVDLGYNYTSSDPNNITPQFNFPGNINGLPFVYDTWSMHFEQDGIDQDNMLGVDQGTNGLDDNNLNGVDDPTEREAPPPYDLPLRGIQIKIRAYEPDSRQVREVTLVQDFLPE